MPDSETKATLDAIQRFNEAFNRERFVGAAAVRAFWTRFFASTPGARFETEEIFASGDRALVRWVFHWNDTGGHVRGVDVMRVRGGKVAEKLAYVKG
jgi:ketosteroid isomerase-like protein